MEKDAETVRFLDDVDLTFSLDSRSAETHQMTSIELTSQPIVFRASYRDINLITTIVTKALELYNNSMRKGTESVEASEFTSMTPMASQSRHPTFSRRVTGTTSRSQPIGSANVVLSKEQVSLR